MGQTLHPSEKKKETVLLVGVRSRKDTPWEVEDSLDELGQLAHTAGAQVLDTFLCKRDKPHPRFFIGKGKAEEIAAVVEEHECDTVLFDDDLTPAQGRNLESLIDAKVIDRTQVILDIFASHAHTKDGRLQVDLARLEYLLPRLRRMWTHLERQRGGIGVRGGPGEQQMEVDRRRIQEKITRLRREIEGVRRHREEMRRGRRRHGWALASLVGYTNAGKSTLLNQLTGAHVVTNDQLFVTLDPTTRKIQLPNHQPVLITDTVGFIRKLPHHLVEAFKATLEEVAEADVLLHVVDCSHPRADQQIDAVNRVLRDLGAQDKPVLGVLNKIDTKQGRVGWESLSKRFDRSVAVSARSGEGLDAFKEAMAESLKDRSLSMRLRIPLREAKLISQLRGAGRIISEVYEDEYLVLEGLLPRVWEGACAPYLIDKGPDRS